jgi:hypothetical protein
MFFKQFVKSRCSVILRHQEKSDTLQTGLQKINLSNTIKGLYLVKVKDPKGNPIKTIKLLVE